MADEYSEEDDDYDYDDDINAVDEDDECYDEEGYEEEEDGDHDEEEEDPDQVAHVDEAGWFYADEETIEDVDHCLAEEDEDYACALTTYLEACGSLAKARIARGFYPVVVPADGGSQPRFGRQGRRKGGGKRVQRKKRRRQAR